MMERERTKPLLKRLRRRPRGGAVTYRQRALLLAMRGQHREAATLLLANLPLPLADTGSEEAEHRRQASLAATYLAKAGDTETAERLCGLLGRSLAAPGSSRPRGTVDLNKTPARDALGRGGAIPTGDQRSATLAPKRAYRPLDIGPTMLAKVPAEIIPSSKEPGSVSVESGSVSVESGSVSVESGSVSVEVAGPPRPTGKHSISPELMRELQTLRIHRSLSAGPSKGSDGAMNTLYPYELGTRIADRFVLEARLGHGGMAAVYRARDLELEEDVAIKVFVQPLGETEADREGLRRFRQELKLSRQLVHPHVIRVYDIGVHEARRYITMELLEGTSLKDLLGAPLDPALALCLLIQAGEGVQMAHSLGVIHRDLKPDNLFVTDEGVVKVMDFGIAKCAYTRGVTLAGTTAGTPEYMSPEQISDFSAVGPAADQYSLGIVAYELLTGVLPFEHIQLVKLFWMHLEHAPPPLRQHQPALSAELEAVVLRMIAKDPTERYPDLPTLIADLARLRDSLLDH